MSAVADSFSLIQEASALMPVTTIRAALLIIAIVQTARRNASSLLDVVTSLRRERLTAVRLR